MITASYRLYGSIYFNHSIQIPVQLQQKIQKINMEKIFNAICYISLCCKNMSDETKNVNPIILDLLSLYNPMYFKLYKQEYNLLIIMFCIKLHEILIKDIIQLSLKIENMFPNIANFNPNVRKIIKDKTDEYNELQKNNNQYMSLLQNLTLSNQDNTFIIIDTHCQLLEKRYNLLKTVHPNHILIKFDVRIYKILKIMLDSFKLDMNILHEIYKVVLPQISQLPSLTHMETIFTENQKEEILFLMYVYGLFLVILTFILSATLMIFGPSVIVPDFLDNANSITFLLYILIVSFCFVALAAYIVYKILNKTHLCYYHNKYKKI